MKLINIKTLLLSSLFSLSALCTVHKKMDCDISANSPLRSAYLAEEGEYVSCAELKQYERILKKVKLFLSDAPPVILSIKRSDSNASFDMGQVIHIPRRLEFNGKYGESYQSSFVAIDSILAHEYGHAVFNERLKDQDFYKDLYTITKKMSRLELLINTFIGDRAILYGHKQEHDKLLNVFRDSQKLTSTRRVVNAYNELFSDVVAVYAFNNKSAITSALYYEEMTDQGFELVLARSFESNSITSSNVVTTEAHALFSETRQFIGRWLWPSNNKEKSKNIDKIFKVIAEEIEARLSLENLSFDPIEANSTLINKLRIEFGLQ